MAQFEEKEYGWLEKGILLLLLGFDRKNLVLQTKGKLHLTLANSKPTD